MKRICHVTSAHPPEDGRIFRRACVAASRAGFETFLVQRGNTYIKNNIQIIGLGIPKRTGRLYRISIFAKLAYEKALSVDADLYHLHDPELLPYALKLKKRGKAVVFDCHEDYVEQIKSKPYLPSFIAKLASKFYDIYSRRIFAVIDGLTYAGNGESPSSFDNLCKRVVPTDNLPWLDELYEKYCPETPKEKNTACYIGGLDKVRGITQIIKACYNAHCTLYLAGCFHSDIYKKQVMAMKEFSCVKYLGVIDRERVIELLQKVEIGLCTLLDVGQYYKMLNLPTKVYEYMSMGIPVIINDSPYNERIIRKFEFGYCVNPNDLDSFSKLLQCLHKNASLREQLGNNGRLAIKEHYSWDKAQEKLIDMYKSILNEQDVI